MIFTDREIRIAIETQQVIIDPVPTEEAYSSTSLDLTLAAGLHVFKPVRPGLDMVVDPSADGYNFLDAIKELADEQDIDQGGFALEPGILILARTQERVNLPTRSRLAARVEGKSSLARLGLGVHITAPTIHAGFSGRIQLEIVNHGSRPIRLRTGMRICQLIFEMTLGVADKGYGGQFLNQMVDPPKT
jgi:dCTP deaminase